jgi:TraB/PrgY/gumN family
LLIRTCILIYLLGIAASVTSHHVDAQTQAQTHAQTTTQTAPSLPIADPAPVTPVVLEKMIVSGEQPGPGMWKVSKGDNVLWLIGTLVPVPQKMTWRAKGVEAIVAKSQEILTGPSVSVGSKQIGLFTALTLLPSAMEARKNPNGITLREVVPPALYPRWLALRDKYVDEFNTNDESKDIERWRPVFAALEVYSQAIKKSGMTITDPVWPVIRDAAKKHNVKITDVKIEPPINEPRAALKQLRASSLPDLDCFAKTIERIETDLNGMRNSANAWAAGDIAAIRSAPASNQRDACEAAFRDAPFLKTMGVNNFPAMMDAAWMDAAEAALAKNSVTLATLPIRRLISADGYVAKLKAKGYTVVEPDSMTE